MPDPKDSTGPSDPPRVPPETGSDLIQFGPTSLHAEFSRPLVVEPPVEPRSVPRGVLVFDLDGTILDDIDLISHVAGDVMEKAFGTPAPEARIHYLATTGMPFEAQLAQLYPEATPAERDSAARIFHERKVREAYATARSFPEMPRLLKRLAGAHWTLVVSTGAEREMADLVLERQGLRFWFEGLLGSGQGTKREHLLEYRRRFPDTSMYLIGDSRFDMEAATASDGVVPLGRASRFPGWTLTPDDLRRWGAVWADYSLAGLAEELEGLTKAGPATPLKKRARRGTQKGRDRDSPKTGDGPASL